MSIDIEQLLPAIKHRQAPLTRAQYARYDAILQLTGDDDCDAPYDDLYRAVRRRRLKDSDTGVLFTLPDGATVVRFALAADGSVFTRQQQLRAALAVLLRAAPRTLAVDVRCRDAAAVAYTVLVAAAKLPAAVADDKPPQITFAGIKQMECSVEYAQANTLARALTQLPPNRLSPPLFAAIARRLAKKHQLSITTYSAARLKKMSAGAIGAVGQAAAHPPLIVRVSYRRRNAPVVALVGKGVCYDTGGVNVKPARYMRGMGKDMAGAAAALGAVIAAAQMRLPCTVEAWLVLAENSIANNAYRPDDVITALNGKRIEVVHSDAEGRMLLADTLTLASRQKPALIITYATLTGTMCAALGTRMSGFFASDEVWQHRALAAAAASGERLCYFPMPADYKDALKSDVADIKQCAEEGDADHIRAALFLREFISGNPPWLHLDLSAAVCKDGLAAAPGDVTGFGAAWTLALLEQWDSA